MRKQKVLCWSDSAVAGTGFGIVSKHVISALHATGLYDIHHLAINFHGSFVDRSVVPWNMQPARLLDPRDPHGIKMFMKTLYEQQYDIVWICNDLYVTHKVADEVRKYKEEVSRKGFQPPTFVYYYPVDCAVPLDGSGFLKVVDVPVCYTRHGRQMTTVNYPELDKLLVEIPHGVDSRTYKPRTKEENEAVRKSFLGVDAHTPVVINVNRNSTRKQLPYSFLAFKEFKKRYPKAKMYLHAAINDQGGNMLRALEDLGLSTVDDVVYPKQYNPSQPISSKKLNMLYNVADIFLTTHLGEGWGLTVTEAMAAGTPVVAPWNTSMPQQLGSNSERGYMYECKDQIWIDSSGYRPKGLIPDIVEQMYKVVEDGSKYENEKVKLARSWAVQHDWRTVTRAWIELFSRIVQKRTAPRLKTAVLGEKNG